MTKVYGVIWFLADSMIIVCVSDQFSSVWPMLYWFDHVYEYTELLFESSLWSFCGRFNFPNPHSPSSACRKPKNYKMSLLKTNVGFIWRFSRQSWCQITLQPELSNSLCFWAR